MTGARLRHLKAVSPAASPSASGVALKKETSNDDATTGNLAPPPSLLVASPALPMSSVQRRTPPQSTSAISSFAAEQRPLPLPSNFHGRKTAFFICSPHRSAHGKKPNVVLVKALLAFSAPNGAKIKATAYHPSPIRLSTEWVASQFFDVDTPSSPAQLNPNDVSITVRRFYRPEEFNAMDAYLSDIHTVGGMEVEAILGQAKLPLVGVVFEDCLECPDHHSSMDNLCLV
nr:DNA (cytosine-5)-methyltransferase 1-like [Ipomoea trifida]